MLEDKIEDVSKLLEDLSVKQEILDKKTRDAAEYRSMNEKLLKLLYAILIIFGVSIVSMIICATLLLNNVINKYLDTNVTETISTTTTDLSTGNNGVLINDLNNSSVSNISK